ncbi:expressed unknown protein [Seminavis robusta]|uniref:Uncharacterized protein n=1 Tax=Seminavis robusta TaxID=568900 RepID=A0A9N8EDW2_9STRA|nr:expressed unknown protein [Seminavis robusta]|eukprot:Sro1034_g233810.1 n/a (219) ;mRNA; f:10633-11289
MTKILAALLATQLPIASLAWAPPGHAMPYSKLPKTLEFAEKAWFLPQADSLSSSTGPQRLSEEHQHRMLPWTHQQHGSITTGRTNDHALHHDRFFFDGYSGGVSEWPTRQAFLQAHPKKTSTELQMTGETLTEQDFYYDDMGTPVSWVARAPIKKTDGACDHHFFDDTGRSTCWKTLVEATEKVVKTAPKVELRELVESCEHPYYDDMGDLMCWVHAS